MIRKAQLSDLEALVALEQKCFSIDLLSKRSFHHFITKGKASLYVFEGEQSLLGYSLVLFHQNTSMARLYSLAVSPDARGKGVASALIDASEKDALVHGVVSMRLEVHVNNETAIELYKRLGYREFAIYPDYYEDHAPAIRMEKSLVPHLTPKNSIVPYYGQTLEFTCGPAAIMMAMKSINPELQLDRQLELRLWREATSIFMTSGHGGCSPFGLAISAAHRGLKVEVYTPADAVMFVDSVRNEEKREVIRIVQEDFLAEMAEMNIPLLEQHISLEQLEEKFHQGAMAVVLISAYRLTGDKSPHWVVISGFDERFVYIHEPYIDSDEGQSETTCFGIPIPRHEFDRMRFYGTSRQYATILLFHGENKL